MCDRLFFWNFLGSPKIYRGCVCEVSGSILVQFSASGGCFEGRSDVFDASQRHFGAFRAPVAPGWELPEAAAESDV